MVDPFVTYELINRKCEAQKYERADQIFNERFHGQSIAQYRLSERESGWQMMLFKMPSSGGN